MKRTFKLVLTVTLVFALIFTQMVVSFAAQGTAAAKIGQPTTVPSSGISRDAYKTVVALTEESPTQELFGHVILVEGYSLPSYTGCHALIALNDGSGTIIAVMTTDQRLQSLLETALATGNLVACWAQKLTDPPTPRGGTWSVDVYNTDGVILYNMK